MTMHDHASCIATERLRVEYGKSCMVMPELVRFFSLGYSSPSLG